MKLFSNSLFLATALILAFETQAAIRFLPDVDQRNSGIEDEDVKMSIDDSLCARSVDRHGKKLYHKANGCPNGMVFDEYCPHSNEWISECYTPKEENNGNTIWTKY